MLIISCHWTWTEKSGFCTRTYTIVLPGSQAFFLGLQRVKYRCRGVFSASIATWTNFLCWLSLSPARQLAIDVKTHRCIYPVVSVFLEDSNSYRNDILEQQIAVQKRKGGSQQHSQNTAVPCTFHLKTDPQTKTSSNYHSMWVLGKTVMAMKTEVKQKHYQLITQIGYVLTKKSLVFFRMALKFIHS